MNCEVHGGEGKWYPIEGVGILTSPEDEALYTARLSEFSSLSAGLASLSAFLTASLSSSLAALSTAHSHCLSLLTQAFEAEIRRTQQHFHSLQQVLATYRAQLEGALVRRDWQLCAGLRTVAEGRWGERGKVYVWDIAVELVELVGSSVYRSPGDFEDELAGEFPINLDNVSYIDLQKAYFPNLSQADPTNPQKSALKSRLDALKATRESHLKQLLSSDCESCQAQISLYFNQFVQSGQWDITSSENVLKHAFPWSQSYEAAAIAASLGLQVTDIHLAIEWLQRTIAILRPQYSTTALYRDCLVQLSRNLAEIGRIEDSLQTVEQIKSPATLVQYGSLLLRIGELKAAKTAFKAAIHLSEPHSRDWGSAASALTKAYFQLRKSAKADMYLSELMHIAKDVWRDAHTEANCMHNATLQALAQGKASDLLEQSIVLRGGKKDGRIVLGYHLRGIQQATQGLLQAALSSIDLAKQLATELFPEHLPYIETSLHTLTLPTGPEMPTSLLSLDLLYIVEEHRPAPLQGLAEMLELQAKQWEVQDWKEAERRYQRAREIGGNRASAGLAVLYTGQGLRPEAEVMWREQIETLNRTQPRSLALAEATLSLAQLLSPEAEAIALSISASELYRQLGQLHNDLASRLLASELLTKHNSLRKAETVLGEVDEDWAQGWEQLGQVYEEMHRLEQAEDCYWKAERAGNRLGKDTASLWLRIGRVREKQGCYPEAVSLLNSAISAVSPALQPLFQTALGRLYRLMGNSAQAEAILKGATSECAEAYYELGQLYIEDNQPKQAEISLSQAIQTTKHRDLHVNALTLLASVQDYPDAVQSLAKAIDVASNWPIGDFRATKSWLKLAELEIYAGKLDCARTYIRSALEYTVKTLLGRILEALALSTALYARLNDPWRDLAARLCCLLHAEELDIYSTGELLVHLEVSLPVYEATLVSEVYSAARAPALLVVCGVYVELQELEACAEVFTLLGQIPLRETERMQATYLYAVYCMWLEDWASAVSTLQQATILAESTYDFHYKRKISTLMSILEARNEPDLNQALAMLFSIHSQANNEELRLLVSFSLQLGQSLHAHNQLEAAEECWRWAVEAAALGEMRKYELKAREALGKLLLGLGIEEEAEKHLKRVVELAEGDCESCVLMGKMYVGQGRLAEAREMYELASRHIPADLSVLTSLSVLLLDLGEVHSAELVLQQAWQHLTSSPGLITANTIEDCLRLGELYGRLQQPLQEQYIYSLLWHLDLSAQWQSQVTQRLADVCVRLELREEAVSVYEKDRKRWEKAGKDWPVELRQRLSLLYIQCGRFSEAHTVFSPQNALDLYTCGQAYSQVLAYPQAIECLEASLPQLNPQQKCTALKLLGEIYIKLKQWPDANRSLQAAFPLASDLPAIDILMSLSQISANQDQLRLACEQLKEAILGLEKLGGNSEGRERLGKCHGRIARIYERIDRPEEAQFHYIEAVNIWEKAENGTTKLGDLYYNLGVFYQKQGQLAKAEGYFLKELSLQAPTPKQADTHHSLGLLYSAFERYDLAKQHYLQAADLCSGPAKAETLCGLGKVCLLSSQFKESRESFEAALCIYEAEGDGKQAERVRKRLASLPQGK